MIKLILPALPYANGPLHIGRIGGSILPADIINRYFKLVNQKSYFTCASDCHGTPIIFAAEKENTSCENFINYWHNRFIQTFRLWNVSMDSYNRTNSIQHQEFVKLKILDLLEKKIIYKKIINVAKCNSCNKRLLSRFFTCICYNCNIENTGLTCESCSTELDLLQVTNIVCKVCNNLATIEKTKEYVINLDTFKDNLLSKYKNTDFFKHIFQYYQTNEVQIKEVFRPIEWGIKIPYDNMLYTVYVWIDALLGYLSFTEEQRKTNYETYHFIGTDNLHFHTIIYEHILQFLNYDSVTKLFVRKWFLFNQCKQSSSRKNYLDLYELNEKKPIDKITGDLFRAYVISKDTTQKENNLSITDYTIFKTSFINIIHNNLYRTFSFIKKNMLNDMFIIKDTIKWSSEYDDYHLNSKLNKLWSLLISRYSSQNNIFQNNLQNFKMLNSIDFSNYIRELVTLLIYIQPICPNYFIRWSEILDLTFNFENKNYSIKISKTKELFKIEKDTLL